jgi:hypothetical protein
MAIESPGRSMSTDDRHVGAAGYLDAVVRAAEAAAHAAGGWHDQRYTFGGRNLLLRCAGPALLPSLAPALAHLIEPEAPDAPAPDLTVLAWDSASTGTPLPALPRALAPRHSDGGADREEHASGIYGVFQPGVNTLSLLDTAAGRAVFWVPDARDVSIHDRGAPLRTLLSWWLGAPDRQLMHSAAVGTPESGVLLAGKGGSGKSTTALACLNSPLCYVGDDYVLVGTTPRPYVASLYSGAKLTDDALARFPHLAAVIANRQRLADEKALLYLHEHFPQRLSRGFPLRAILLPVVTGRRETLLRPASAAASLAALAPSTIFLLPLAGRTALGAMAALVRQVPSYMLELGTEIERIPGIILLLLSELSEA